MFSHAAPLDKDQSLAIRAAWLSYVGGYTQEQVAERLGVSRIKAHRLLAQAMADGAVTFFVEGVPADCIALEDKLMARHGLKRCTVVPHNEEDDDTDTVIAPLAMAGARHLMRELDVGGVTRIGIGHGRTLAALVGRLPSQNRPELRFVSLMGSLTRSSAANPFDVIARLAERTGGECYFLPVPFIADSRADAEVLRTQRGVQQVFALARECQLCVVSVGALGPTTHLLHNHSVTPAELQTLRDAGAVGELVGRFLAADGSLVDCEMNERAVGTQLDDLRGRDVLVVAGGKDKADAIRAVLRTGVVTALIVDEATALAVLRDDNPAHGAPN